MNMESYNVKFYSGKSCMETFEDRPRKVSKKISTYLSSLYCTNNTAGRFFFNCKDVIPIGSL